MTTDGTVNGQFERTEEFDAFGPWVLPVQTVAEVPRLFRQHVGDPATATVVIKVPRNISRRDAHPRMDLYDHLLELRGTRLTVVSRAPGAPGGVRTRALDADHLLTVQDGTDLLDGRLIVHALDEPPLTVRYNGASRDVVAPLVAGIRALWRDSLDAAQQAPAPTGIPLGLRDLGPDVALVAEYRELVGDEPAMALLGAHPRRVVDPASAGALGRAVHRVWPMWLQGAVVCSDGVELLVLHRRSWWVRGSRPVHSVVRTVLPLSRSGPPDVVPTAYTGVSEIRLHGDAARFAVPSGSPTERCLLEVLR